MITKLKELRIEKGLTQKDLGKQIGYKSNSISDWERGLTEPNIELVKKLAEIFDVSVDYLLGLETDYGVKTFDTNIIKRPEAALNLKQEEIKILDIYKQLDIAFKAQLLGYAEALLLQQRYKIKPQK